MLVFPIYLGHLQTFAVYLDDLRDRTPRGLQGWFARGLHTGGRIFGYRSVPVVDPAGRVDAGGRPLVIGTDLVIEPAEALGVRQIFEWFISGLSLQATAHRLNAQAMSFTAQHTRRGPKRKPPGEPGRVREEH